MWYVSRAFASVDSIIDHNSNQVLTTYAVLESCFRKQQNGFKRKGKIIKEKSPMHEIHWSRIVVRIDPFWWRCKSDVARTTARRSP